MNQIHNGEQWLRQLFQVLPLIKDLNGFCFATQMSEDRHARLERCDQRRVVLAGLSVCTQRIFQPLLITKPMAPLLMPSAI